MDAVILNKLLKSIDSEIHSLNTKLVFSEEDDRARRAGLAKLERERRKAIETFEGCLE